MPWMPLSVDSIASIGFKVFMVVRTLLTSLSDLQIDTQLLHRSFLHFFFLSCRLLRPQLFFKAMSNSCFWEWHIPMWHVLFRWETEIFNSFFALLTPYATSMLFQDHFVLHHASNNIFSCCSFYFRLFSLLPHWLSLILQFGVAWPPLRSNPLSG